MEGEGYVMRDCFGISSAYLSSGVSTRGQRRLHHAANGRRGWFAREEGDGSPQNSCRIIRKLKGSSFAFGLPGHGIYLARRVQSVR
jgi:hypothetical protein